MAAGCFLVAWLLVAAFNFRQFVAHWLDEFGKVTRGDVVFFSVVSIMGPVASPFPLIWFVRRHTDISVGWNKAVWVKNRDG